MHQWVMYLMGSGFGVRVRITYFSLVTTVLPGLAFSGGKMGNDADAIINMAIIFMIVIKLQRRVQCT
ncbi:hypothetical protein DXT88_13115 [Herbaspirillum lusitanum]|nr:hypothetical protein [Herbaspirillum lusitanum]